MSSLINKIVNTTVKYAYIHDFQLKPLDVRKVDSDKILSKYPDRIPVIVDVFHLNAKSINLDKHKYLVPADLMISQFMYIIRKRCKLTPEKAIFLFIENTLPPSSMLMGEIYKNKKNIDGFLYITISEESTFGVLNN